MKDKFFAKIAFFLSLGFWIPLFNVGLCIASIIIGFMAIRKIMNEPNKYGGMGYAVTAIVLSVTSLVLSLLGLIIYLSSEQICSSAVCLGSA